MKNRDIDSEMVRFRKAKEMWANGNNREAVIAFSELIENNPESSILRAFLGNTYSEMGEFSKAEESFRMAVNLSPKNERCSVGLFHSLWDQGKHIEAIEEKVRFTNIVDSQEYKDLWKDFGIEE